MPDDADQHSSQDRTGGQAADAAGCRAMPLRVGVEATDEILAALSTAGMNALADPDDDPPARTIVEVDADSAEEAGRKIRDVLGEVPIEPAE